MTEKEIKLAADLLLLASDQFANHGCNDMPDEYFKDWTLEERQTLVRQYWEWNGTPQEYDPEFLHIGDSFLMYFLAEKLKKHTVSEIVESFTQPPTPVWVSVEDRLPIVMGARVCFIVPQIGVAHMRELMYNRDYGLWQEAQSYLILPKGTRVTHWLDFQ